MPSAKKQIAVRSRLLLRNRRRRCDMTQHLRRRFTFPHRRSNERVPDTARIDVKGTLKDSVCAKPDATQARGYAIIQPVTSEVT